MTAVAAQYSVKAQDSATLIRDLRLKIGGPPPSDANVVHFIIYK